MKRICTECRRRFEPVRRDAVTCSPACHVKRYRRLQAQTPPFPSGTFDLLMIDLPLRFDTWSDKGEGRSPQRHYPTMDVAALIRMMKGPIADLCARNVAACFWVYGPRVPDTLKVIEGGGFTYKSELFVWKKPSIGNGLSATRKNCETAWLATRGKGLQRIDRGVEQTIEAPRIGGHSAKPDEAYEKLERLYGDVRRIDLFGRWERLGWTVWGNDVVRPPRVINMHGRRGIVAPGAVYVGGAVDRAGTKMPQSKWANRFEVGRHGATVEDVIGKYRDELLASPHLMADLHELRGKFLACWCSGPDGKGNDKRAPCHADVLLELANA